MGEDTTLNFMLPLAPPEFTYPMEGWSYYARAFNMFREQPRAEIGWGQWTKPSSSDSFNEVCGVNPRGFTCQDNSGPEGCSGSYTDMEQCTYWVCGEEGLGGVRGSIEGGMGYWPSYTIETSQVKWNIPGSTNANYEHYGGTFLGDREQPCRNLGGAVRISNQLLVPNDFISFEGGEDINGFLGYMLQKTPLGKRSPTDDANYWTIIADTANFKGPVLMMSAYFWDRSINWHPSSKSWSHPDAKLGYIAIGYEGGIAAMQSKTESDESGNLYARTTQWGVPVDDDGLHSTLFTGITQYSDGWLDDLLNDVMDGNNLDPQIASAADAARVDVACGSVGNDDMGTHARLESRDTYEYLPSEYVIDGFGINSVTDHSVGCPMKLSLDKSKLDCDSEPGMCLAKRYFTVNGDSKFDFEVPESAKSSISDFPILRVDNREFHGPPKGPEQQCFSQPSSALYCTRTNKETWIGFRWYKFVDQPEMTNVFLSLPEGERQQAKDFMQARIENLHRAADKETPWFGNPGDGPLPKEKVSIDESLLVTPPAGMEVGYVPIAVYERKRAMPVDCEVVVGAYEDEPDPVPADYYVSEHYEFNPAGHGRSEDDGFCYDGGSYPGVMFFHPPDPSADRLNYAYEQPVSDLSVPTAPVEPVLDPLIQLDKTPSSTFVDTGGREGITETEWLERGGAYEPCDCPPTHECIEEAEERRRKRRKLFGDMMEVPDHCTPKL